MTSVYSHHSRLDKMLYSQNTRIVLSVLEENGIIPTELFYETTSLPEVRIKLEDIANFKAIAFMMAWYTQPRYKPTGVSIRYAISFEGPLDV